MRGAGLNKNGGPTNLNINKQGIQKNGWWWGVCITASGNILVCGNNSIKLFMAPLETIELLTFSFAVAEYHFAQL